MTTVSLTPMLNEKTNNLTYVTTVKNDVSDENVMSGNYIKLPDNSEQIRFIPSQLPYQVLPRLTERGTVILELQMDQFIDLRHRLETST